MKTMIFAAGLGTRLKPLTDTLPKALVPVCGKPLIEHVCRRLMAGGIDEAVVNVHHFADKVQEWIFRQEWVCPDSASKTDDRMLVQVSDETERLLETGGAVLHAQKYLDGCGRFLIHNVDILSNLDIRWFETQVRDESLATLLVSRRQSSRQLLFDPQTMRLVGWRNNATGEIRSPYAGLDADACAAFAFSGIHIMSDAVFPLLKEYAQTHGLCITDEPPRFPVMDFYLWVCAAHEIRGVVAEDLKMIDVGKLDSLNKAEEFILESAL